MKKIQLKLKFRYLLTIAFILFLSYSGNTQIIEKTIIKTIKFNSKDVIRINNKQYIGATKANMYIKTWDKNELKIEYKVYAEAKSQEKVDNFYNELKRIIDSNLKSMSFGSIELILPIKLFNIHHSNKTILKFENNSQKHYLKKYETTIVIYVPKTNNLNIKSGHNNLFIENIHTNLNLNISYSKLLMKNCKNLSLKANFAKNMIIGNTENAEINIRSSDIEMGDVKNNLNLKANYSSFKNTKIGNKANIEIKSSKFETTNIKELILDGSFIRYFKINNVDKAIVNIRSSEFEAVKINTLEINNAFYSTFKINKINELSILSSKSSKFNIINANKVKALSCSFSDFNINNLKTSFTNSSKSGSIKLLNVSAGFSKINIDGQFVNININVEENTNYRVSADLQYPQEYRFIQINTKDIEKTEKKVIFSGWKGNKNAKSEIIFNCKTCDIKLN